MLERIEGAAVDLGGLPGLQQELASLEGVGERLAAAHRLVERSAALDRTQAALEAHPEIDVDRLSGELEAAEAVSRTATEHAAAARARVEHEMAALSEAEERLARATEADPSQPCPTCGRPLGDDFTGYLKHCREEVAASKKRVAAASRGAKQAQQDAARAEADRGRAAADRAEAEKAGNERVRLEREVEGLQAELDTLLEVFGGERPDAEVLEAAVAREREIRGLVAALEERAKQLDQLREDLSRKEVLLDEVQGKLGQLAAEADGLGFDALAHSRLESELADADGAVQTTQALDREASTAAADVDKILSRLEGEITRAQETAARVDELRTEARYLERTAMLLDGFRDQLVSRVGPELSREAEALFRELTDHEYEDLRIDDETLAIQIADGDSYFPIERFSGSEADLANLALRVAISVHLSRVSGADVGMMVLDEVLASLDQERKDLMVQAMGKLSSRFHQLFVITHAEQVKDQFPASIVVSKTGRRRSSATLI